MSYWDKKENLSKYVGGVRQFFPLAEEQLDMISRIIEKFNPSINTFLDLGCGDGFLGYFIYELYFLCQRIMSGNYIKCIGKII